MFTVQHLIISNVSLSVKIYTNFVKSLDMNCMHIVSHIIVTLKVCTSNVATTVLSLQSTY